MDNGWQGGLIVLRRRDKVDILFYFITLGVIVAVYFLLLKIIWRDKR